MKEAAGFEVPIHRSLTEQILMGGVPRQGQKLEDVKTLFLDEIEKIKNGPAFLICLCDILSPRRRGSD